MTGKFSAYLEQRYQPLHDARLEQAELIIGFHAWI